MTVPVAVVLAMLALNYVVYTWLDILNIRSIRANEKCVPQAFASFMDAETYAKSLSYTLDKTRFGIFEGTCNSIFLALLFALWIIPTLFDFGIDIFGTSVLGQSITIVLITVVLSVPSLPFELYSQFVIEEEYGFNKSTLKLWVVDKIKSLFVGLILGAPILTVILWFSETFKNTWWLWGFFAVAMFQLVMVVLYPRLIMPLFNKLEPLPDGELKTRLLALSERGGFHASTIQVMDGSKRSSHSNAFFTGFGRFRRIVLFDTLIEQLSEAEIEAVLAHEIDELCYALCGVRGYGMAFAERVVFLGLRILRGDGLWPRLFDVLALCGLFHVLDGSHCERVFPRERVRGRRIFGEAMRRGKSEIGIEKAPQKESGQSRSAPDIQRIPLFPPDAARARTGVGCRCLMEMNFSV